MGNMALEQSDAPPEFQKYLWEKKRVPAKNEPFFAYWVSRFLEYARRHERPVLEYQESTILEFMNFLESGCRVLDWQYRQATDAIKLYSPKPPGSAPGERTKRERSLA